MCCPGVLIGLNIPVSRRSRIKVSLCHEGKETLRSTAERPSPALSPIKNAWLDLRKASRVIPIQPERARPSSYVKVNGEKILKLKLSLCAISQSKFIQILIAIKLIKSESQ